MPCHVVACMPCCPSTCLAPSPFPPATTAISALQGLLPSSPRQGLPYQTCCPGYLIWVSRLPHLEKMCLRIPSAGTVLPRVGDCCLPPPHCAWPCALHPTWSTIPPNQPLHSPGTGDGLPGVAAVRVQPKVFQPVHLVLGFLKHRSAAPKDHSKRLYSLHSCTVHHFDQAVVVQGRKASPQVLSCP